MEEKPTIDLMSRIMRKSGFSTNEVELVTLFVFEGYSLSNIAEYCEEVFDERQVDEEYLDDLIRRFQQTMSAIGRKSIENVLNEAITVDSLFDKDSVDLIEEKTVDTSIKALSFESKRIMDQDCAKL